MIRKPIASLSSLLAVALASALAPAQASLTLRQAMELATQRNPQASEARAGVAEARAGVQAARAQYLPQASLTEDFSHGDDPVYAFGARLRQQRFTNGDFDPVRLNTPAAMSNVSTRIGGQWLLFDSLQREKSVRGARAMEQSAQQAAEAVDQRLLFATVAAYQSILYAERRLAVAQHQLETAQALASTAAERVQAGLAVASDRISADVYVASCRQGLIAAQGELELAWARLRLATGSPELPAQRLQPLEAREYPQGELEQEVQRAERERRDLASAESMRAAQADSVRAAKATLGPRLSAYGNWETDRGSFAGAGGTNYVAGVQATIDLLPVGKRAQLASEQAGRMRAEAQLASRRQELRMQVTQAHIERQTARASLETARAAVEQAAESLRILRNRYGAGLATMTDLLRAEDAEREAQANYWRSVYGDALAYAQLLFATGSLSPEAAEVLQ